MGTHPAMDRSKPTTMKVIDSPNAEFSEATLQAGALLGSPPPRAEESRLRADQRMEKMRRGPLRVPMRGYCPPAPVAVNVKGCL